MESELEQERKERALAVAAKKKIELDMKDLEHQNDLVAKVRDDSVKHLKKLQNQLKDYQREIDEVKTQKDQLTGTFKDMEKKYKQIENESIRFQEDAINADRARKAAENDREELEGQLHNLGLIRYSTNFFSDQIFFLQF
jgi:myosin heavy chain 9/10/11/14